VLGALDGLVRGLEAVAHLLEQEPDHPVGDLVAHALQGLGQLAGRLERPAQGRYRVAPGVGLHQVVEVGQQRRVDVLQARPASTFATYPPRRGLFGVEGLGPVDHGVAGHPRRVRHRRHAASTEQPGHTAGQQPALLLIQVLGHELEEPPQALLVQLHAKDYRLGYLSARIVPSRPLSPEGLCLRRWPFTARNGSEAPHLDRCSMS
jgi:hypothetical protein